MRALLAGALMLVVGACAGRQVEVRTGPQPAAETSLRVTNNLSQPINVYVVNGGTDSFVSQVAANSTAVVAVRGVAAGTTVMLKAVPADGTRNYTRDNVTLTGTYEWRVP